MLVITIILFILGGLLFLFFQHVFDLFLEQQQEETMSIVTSQIRAKLEREKEDLLREIETIGQQELFQKNTSILMNPLISETSASKIMAYHQLDFFLSFLTDTLFLDFIAIQDTRGEFVFGYNQLSYSLFPLEDWGEDPKVKLLRYDDTLIIIGQIECEILPDQSVTVTSGFLLDNSFLHTLTGDDQIPLFLLDGGDILLSSSPYRPPLSTFFEEKISWESQGTLYRGKIRPFLQEEDQLYLGMLFDLESYLLSRLRIQRGLFVLLFFLLVFSLLFGGVLSRSILSPIQHLIGSIVRVARGNYQSTLTLGSPITEIKTLGQQYNHMLERLADNRKYIQNLSDSLPLGLLTYDEQGQIRYVNDFFLKVFHGERKEFLGHSVDGWSYGLYFRKNQGKQDWSLKIDHRSLRISSFTFTTEKGLQYLHVLRDVTREILYQKQLMENERQAAIGKVTAALAHEINNPLGVIHSYLELMENEEYIPEIRSELERISRLMKDMMAMVRGQTQLEKKEVLLDTWLDGWEDMLYWKANQKSIDLTIKKSYERGSTLSFDANKMRQALLNLFLNSLDACREGDWVVISLLLEEEFCVEVRDSGRGIDEELFPYIFEPFVSSKSPSQGTGLGLSVVQTVARLHGGVVEVILDKGCTLFVLRIPREDPSLPVE